MIALISLAYLEEDGVLLSIALLAAIIVLTVETVVVWRRSSAQDGSWASDNSLRALSAVNGLLQVDLVREIPEAMKPRLPDRVLRQSTGGRGDQGCWLQP